MEATIKPNEAYPHLDDIKLSNEHIELTIIPQANMLMSSLLFNNIEVLAPRDGLKGYVEDLSSTGLPLMAPWINRLSTTEYSFDGKHISFNKEGMKVDENGYPMHGLLTAHKSWTYEIVETKTSVSIVGLFHYNADNVKHFDSFPFPHTIKLTYKLLGKNLIVETEVMNLTDGKMPVAFGFHPHFNNVKKIDIHGINYKIPVNSKTIPVKPSEFDSKDCDTTAHMYKMINNWHVTMLTTAGKVEMTTSGYPYMLHWTPPNSNYIAVEPMMSNIDLFKNNGATVINKDETYTAIFKLSF